MTRLADLTTPEVGDRRVLLLPIGSLEQHGPHLPLDTDTVIATTVAQRAAVAVPAAVVAPAIAIGASGEHAGFAGTLSIGTDVMASALVEIVRTAGAEFERVVVVNGHGGNLDAVRIAVTRCAEEGRRLTAWHAALVGGDAHAGATETSVMLAIDPNRVRLDRAEPGVVAPLADILDDLRAGGLAAVTPNGVLGDPTTADAAVGETILDEWVRQVVELLRS
ncbi:MAG: mycofactocin biosynthesis peptidyl-dipeptidase MftE [Actinomycetota bacterium]